MSAASSSLIKRLLVIVFAWFLFIVGLRLLAFLVPNNYEKVILRGDVCRAAMFQHLPEQPAGSCTVGPAKTRQSLLDSKWCILELEDGRVDLPCNAIMGGVLKSSSR